MPGKERITVLIIRQEQSVMSSSSRINKRKRKRTTGEEEAMTSTSALLKGQGSTTFADRWPEMQPVVLKLLKQEHVTRDEWQNLFW